MQKACLECDSADIKPPGNSNHLRFGTFWPGGIGRRTSWRQVSWLRGSTKSLAFQVFRRSVAMCAREYSGHHMTALLCSVPARGSQATNRPPSLLTKRLYSGQRHNGHAEEKRVSILYRRDESEDVAMHTLPLEIPIKKFSAGPTNHQIGFIGLPGQHVIEKSRNATNKAHEADGENHFSGKYSPRKVLESSQICDPVTTNMDPSILPLRIG